MKIRSAYGDKNRIGKSVYRLRTERGMTQAELLVQMQLRGIDIGASSLSALEGQRRLVRDFEVTALADIFSVSAVSLLS